MSGRRPAGPSRGERASATVFATVFIAVLATVALGCSTLGGLLVAQRRAASAADLAALAGAGAVQHGRPGCAAAQAMALENDATVRACRTSGEVVTLEVEREVAVWAFAPVTLTAKARAGPG
ncbi:MAG: Rv3654c family TadE-like protein [Marmoricola sp.]